MMALLEHYPWLKSLWTVWFFAMFVGVVVWAMLPSRRQHFQQMAQIPLKDEDPVRRSAAEWRK